MSQQLSPELHQMGVTGIKLPTLMITAGKMRRDCKLPGKFVVYAVSDFAEAVSKLYTSG